MGLGTVVGDILTLGVRARKRNKKAKKERAEARAMIEQNTALAQQMLDRDLGQTAFTGMQADPEMVAAQRQALTRMQDTAREGYTDVDRQAMQQQLHDVARYEQAQRQSLAADARARGVSGSGLDLMSQMAAQQAGADRAMATGTDMALAGRDRAYAANADAAAQAGAMRGQDWGERSQVAGAQDQYGQWRVGQQSQDAAALMNARGGHAQVLNDSALQREQAFDQGANTAANLVGSIYGMAGAGGGSAPANAVSAPGAKSMAQPTAQPTTPSPTAPPGYVPPGSVGGGAQKAMPQGPQAQAAGGPFGGGSRFGSGAMRAARRTTGVPRG